MKGYDIKSIGIFIFSAIILYGCRVTKPYVAPSITTDSLFRDVHTSDTTTIAGIPYSVMFTDPHLQNLIQEGVANNYNLKVAVARIKQAEATLMQSKLAFFPDISAGPQVTLQRSSALQGGGVVSNNTIYQLSGSASWEADIWGKLKSSSRAALASLLGSYAYRRAVQTQLVSDIATNYYNLLAYDKQLAITIETVQNRKADVETNKSLKEADKVTEAAVAQSEANLYAAEVTIPDIQNNIRQIENAISVLTAKQPGPIERDSLSIQTIDTSLLTGVPAQLLANRPDVQQAEFNIRFYFEQINVARAYFYPSLTITAQGGWQNTTLKSLFNTSALFGNLVGGLLQPVFSKGLNRQRLAIAKAQYEENVATFQQTVLGAGEEVSDALYSYQAVLNKRSYRNLQLDALQRSVTYNRELLKNGYATYTDVLTSEQGLLSAQLSSVSDRLQQLTAVVSLYRSLGGGWK